MTLRLTAEHLEDLPNRVRRQVEGHIVPVDDNRPVNCSPQKNHKVVPSEEDDGRALTAWMDSLVMRNGLRPGLFWFHTPNGLARTKAMGGVFKAQGLRKGWPDYGLMLPAGAYHGFWLEIKKLNGPKPSAEQLDILARLEQVGFKCTVAWGFDDAKRQTQRYLDLLN